MDNVVYEQPDKTIRDNLNGLITDLGSGNFKWNNIKGNTISFSLVSTDRYMAHCKIKDRIFIITLSNNNLTVKFQELTLIDNVGTLNSIWEPNNTDLNLSFDWPIRSIFGFYENEDIQRIYWCDYHNGPRCINVEKLPSDVKFIEFFPVINKVFGSLGDSDLSSGGSLKAGNYFLCWRYYTDDGYYSDWSYLFNPITVTGSSPGTTVDDYQAYQGMAPDKNTGIKLTVDISDIDNDYDNIQVAVFYSNDYEIVNPGLIFYDGGITGTDMTFILTGSENLGTVTIDDLILTSIKIESFKDNVVAKKQNVIAAIKERPELDLPEYMEANISVAIKALPIDSIGVKTFMTSPSDSKALFGVKNPSVNEAVHILIRGQWYEAVTAVTWNNGSGNIDIAQGDKFYVSVYTTPSWVSGTFKAITLVRKYRLSSGVMDGNVNTDYRYKTEDLNGEYYDWKSQKICKTYKSYPQGEKVRLGVLFFDKTGRPFFVRHLRNTNVTYGLGDTNVPKRSISNPLLVKADFTAQEGTGYYESICAELQYLWVSELDITSIRDKIGGFMIVRAPIIRQYLGMGVLVPTYLTGNDVHSFPGLYAYGYNITNYFGCYDFYCPEDLFNFKGFVIQKHDEIENIEYVSPYCTTATYTINSGTFKGFGIRESNDIDFYQKFAIETTAYPIFANGIPEVSHEILNVTKYILGDDNLPINPLDPTKLYKEISAGYDDNYDHHAGANCNHSILMLDIDDSSNNVKGVTGTDCPNTNPKALLCSLKRPNADPYGGYSNSSVANTIYVSTGHFQEINDSVLNDIEKDGKYIFNDIEIFGGDTFVSLFDLKRLYINGDGSSTIHLGHGMIFPVETRINLTMRDGYHFAKDRSYDPYYNIDGIRLKVGYTKLEQFNYNDGYSTDDINRGYLPLPFNFTNEMNFPTRIRFSPPKNYGEKVDNFRIFLANDYIDLDPNNGEISNIRLRHDRLVYWQPDEVGYIPIKERALTQTNTGNYVQLGVGGIFERYDNLIIHIGNSHQFGLTESAFGFHWFDSRRKIYLFLSSEMEISSESILLGCDRFFQNSIPDNFEQYDNPLTGYGTYGIYDGVSKTVFTTFKLPDDTIKTIGVDIMLVRINYYGVAMFRPKFVGFFDISAAAYLQYKNHSFHISSDLKSGWIHGIGTYMNFFGTQYSAKFSIVVKEESNTNKVFDTFSIIGNNNFFNKIKYENSEQSIEETVGKYVDDKWTGLIRDLRYRKRSWLGNYPKVSRERIADGYCQVTFELTEPYPVEVYQVVSQVRKLY